MIIGFSGLKGSGKDTAGAYLIKQYDFERRAFADPLKKSVAALFDIPFWEIDKFKNEDNVFVAIGYKNQPSEIDVQDYAASFRKLPNHMWSPISEFSFRHFLQRYGTESHREIFGYNFWVDQALPIDGYYADRKIVVTDVRFVNECERIQALNGIVIKLVRGGDDWKDHHRSEQEISDLQCNFTLENNGTVEELYKQIDDLLTTYPNEGF